MEPAPASELPHQMANTPLDIEVATEETVCSSSCSPHKITIIPPLQVASSIAPNLFQPVTCGANEVHCYFPYSQDLMTSMSEMIRNVKKHHKNKLIHHVELTLFMYNGFPAKEDYDASASALAITRDDATLAGDCLDTFSDHSNSMDEASSPSVVMCDESEDDSDYDPMITMKRCRKRPPMKSTCSECGAIFGSKVGLTSHMKVHRRMPSFIGRHSTITSEHAYVKLCS